jgi:hypothetical protein
MSDEEIIAFWGRENLNRWPAYALEDVTIPAEAKRFLIEVGLPRYVEGLEVEFVQETLPRHPEHPTLRIIGNNIASPICIDEASGGRVLIVTEDNHPLFMNSDVQRLASFITVMHQYYAAAERRDEEPRIALFADFKERLRLVDPEALTSDAWKPLLDEMEWAEDPSSLWREPLRP